MLTRHFLCSLPIIGRLFYKTDYMNRIYMGGTAGASWLIAEHGRVEDWGFFIYSIDRGTTGVLDLHPGMNGVQIINCKFLAKKRVRKRAAWISSSPELCDCQIIGNSFMGC